MRIPLIAAAIASVPFLSPVNAANLLQCVDPDVSNAFLVFRNEPDRRITDEVPVFYESIPIPESFTFVGSSQSTRAVSVANRTALPPVEAQESVEQTLITSGWDVAPIATQIDRSGFQSSEVRRRQGVFCNGRDEAVSIASAERDAKTYVVLWSSGKRDENSCSQQPQSYRDYGITDELMPSLSVPETARSTSSGRGGVIRSSGDDADTHIRLITSMSSGELGRYFELQLADQGWAIESSWAGEVSSGSVWTLVREGLPKTAGTLQLFRHSDDDVTVRFSLLAM